MSRIPFLFSILVAILAATPSFAQGSRLRPGDFDVLPLSPEALQGDHLVPAANEDGHVLVVWESTRADTGQFQIEGTLLYRRDLGGKVEFQHQGNIVLGDPTFNFWRTSSWYLSSPDAIDDCMKPTVSAVGKNFVVSWTRRNRSRGLHPYVVEQVLVVPPDPANGIHEGGVVRPEPRRGFFLWDPSRPTRRFIGGDSGMNVATTWVQSGPGGPKDRVALVHVSQTREDPRPHSVLNEFDVFGWHVDWSGWWEADFRPQVEQFRNAATGRMALVEDVRCDEVGEYELGGRMPLYLVESKTGALVLAHEVMESADRKELSQDAGRIVLRSFVPGAFPADLIPVSSQRLVSLNDSRAYHRRPNISTDPDHPLSIHVVSWIEVDPRKNNQGFHPSGGAFARFDVDSQGKIVRVGQDHNFTNPSNQVADARGLLELDRQPPLALALGVNNAASDGFEIFAWNGATRQLNSQYVPDPGLIQAYTPRRPLAVRSKSDVTLVVFDARLQPRGNNQLPIVYIRAE